MARDFEIRGLPHDRRNELRLGLAFAFSWDEGYLDRGPDPHFDALYEADRSRCAFDGEIVVATLAAFSLEMTVPGNVLPTAGTTHITVRPTHRRQGLLRRLMAAHFDDIRERGEPLSALWASESSIYRRFGYGVAAELCGERIDRADTSLLPSPSSAEGRCRMVDAAEALALLPEAYDRARLERAGMMARSELWWRHRVLRDAEYDRMGGTPLRRVIYERNGQPEGYLLYRTRTEGERAELIGMELVGATSEAERELCALACSVDLVDRITLWNRPLDCPLPLMLEAPRELRRVVRDALWVRLTDVEAALSARSYAAEGRVRLGVSDPSWPDNEGVFELDASGGGARCSRVNGADPDVVLDIADLGAAYLGGVRFTALGRANRAQGSPEALRLADALFQCERPPYNPEIF